MVRIIYIHLDFFLFTQIAILSPYRGEFFGKLLRVFGDKYFLRRQRSRHIIVEFKDEVDSHIMVIEEKEDPNLRSE